MAVETERQPKVPNEFIIAKQQAWQLRSNINRILQTRSRSTPLEIKAAVALALKEIEPGVIFTPRPIDKSWYELKIFQKPRGKAANQKLTAPLFLVDFSTNQDENWQWFLTQDCQLVFQSVDQGNVEACLATDSDWIKLARKFPKRLESELWLYQARGFRKRF